MTTATFKSAVAAANVRPKGVIVSPDLFRALEGENLLERKLATPWGLPAPSLGIELPYYDHDVYVACDPILEGYDFKLPPAST